jgi:hypothetical protein
MLAEEFGYAVSPVPAARVTPGLLDVIGRAHRRRRRFRCGAAAVTGAAVLGGAAALGMNVLYLAPAAVLCVVLLTLGTVATGREIANTVRVRPWQVWPARITEIPGRAFVRRLSLLAPDRTVAAAFTGAVPPDVWEAMTDGHGLVWFAGDLRFGGVVTLPGSTRYWTVKPAPPEPAKPARAGPSLEDELIREAGKAAVWNVLG